MTTRDLTEKLRAWSYRRQYLGRAADEPIAALRDIVAVYSSHPTTPLSLLVRNKEFPRERLGEMEWRKEVVRIPAMRRSAFLVPTEMAARLFAVTRPPAGQYTRSLRNAELDRDGYERLKARVLKQTREPISARDLGRMVPTETPLMHAVSLMNREGVVLRIGTSLRTASLLYVATDAWLGHPLKEVDETESLTWLAEAYLRGYGPARLADFAWWSGVARRRAKEALAAVETVDLGDGLLLPADQEDAFAVIEPLDPDAIDVLPKWDAYTMGYAPDGRQRLVTDEHLPFAYTTAETKVGAMAGDGLPLILRGGLAVASWSHRFDGNRLLVTISPFPRNALSLRLYQHAFDEIGHLLSATEIEITTAT